MASDDIRATTTTDLTTGVADFSVDTQTIDEATTTKEIRWLNPDWAEYLGYFKTLGAFRRAVIAMSIWTAGKGYEVNSITKGRLEKIKGWGKETFTKILIKMVQEKMVNGDSFAEIIRKDDTNPTSPILNLKSLNPSRCAIVVNRKGLILGYDLLDVNGNTSRRLKPERVFHLTQMRCANEIQGT